MKKIFILIIVSILVSCSNNSKKVNTKTNKSIKKFEITFDKSKISKYSIVEEENQSVKAMTNNLSSYSKKELNNLPFFKRKIIRIVIPTFISKENLKNTLKYIVFNKTREDSDLDELIIFAYDNKKDIDNFFTFGKLIWAPKGKLGNISPDIARSNIRDNYKIVTKIKDKVGNIKKSEIPTKREFAIYSMFSDDKYLDYSEDKLSNLVMKKFNIKSKKELDKIIIKVQAYKFY